jgi:hypothetical protein
MAIAQDGTVLASHVCSDHGYARHDMGFTGSWKHDAYNEHYPDGWELEMVEDAKPGEHTGLDEAFRLNCEAAKCAEVQP